MADWPRQSPVDVALRGACPRCRQRMLRVLKGWLIAQQFTHRSTALVE
jgi:uncharacterized protein (DUF983 family)